MAGVKVLKSYCSGYSEVITTRVGRLNKGVKEALLGVIYNMKFLL